ncbi:CPBP family intramembrane glutamic endopeptidase [Chryseobacterium paridis]|uniref:CPBP family intramembrane metalloprotease n=1 Tax=Chryseobacterium paridis TaxID=2800328 RepID=A0ABS1FWD6_9FLAO|nr:CPBP family intramembrane glutamic endopeptidase [Chryseobacterium paridis]MBK1896747.1 CPBP family intramembrane metalloprotease [Chryseobacterium paridis]
MERKESAKMLLLFSVLIICLFTQLISVVGLLIILAFVAMVYGYSMLEKNQKYSRFLYHAMALGIFVFSIVVFQHLLPGFNNVLIFDKIQVSKDAVPFTMYFNIDKTLTGLILLLFVVPWEMNFKSALKKNWYLIIIAVLLLMGLTLLFNFVKIDIKFHSYFFIWALNNLLFVVMAEEVLFRGFFQRHLSLLNIKNSGIIAVFIAALAFGALHWQGGIWYVLYAAIAGMMYGLIYYRAKNIILNIVSHFILNLIHILFFTYPFLK